MAKKKKAAAKSSGAKKTVHVKAYNRKKPKKRK